MTIPRRLGDGFAAALVLAALAGCGDGGGARYALDSVLRVNHLQAKGTHNSYHQRPGEPLPTLIREWNYTMPTLTDQLERDGVRQVELDVHFQLKESRLAVYHIPLVDPRTVCFWFSDCLAEIKAWSDAHPDHHPLMILVEPKDDIDLVKLDDHLDEIDAEIREVWPLERVLTPDRVRGAASTLGEALSTTGWPTLGESRGTVLFALNDGSHLRDIYVEGNRALVGKMMFARYEDTDPNASVLVIDGAAGRESEIAAALANNKLVRSTADGAASAGDGDTSDRDAALTAGSQYISTDFPEAGSGPNGYSFAIPGGTPSGCNPVTAPPECTSEAIENLGG